jgi:hypothetical protein
MSERIMTEREAFRFAFGAEPDPEGDGAGRDCYADLMRAIKRERQRPQTGQESSR